MPVVTLYTKAGCHLCEAAEQVIVSARHRWVFDLVRRDILDDPADYERYKHAIPVVLVGVHEIARHKLAAADLDAALGDAAGDATATRGGASGTSR